ncbi:helix-turn-helix domain-containing protein [Kitasatospora sp. NPDC093558]|uniref:helix-turn-helix domain-containing protein n=1 Tax=Kitasatospora sp. NPDC093558 TaxID=3155201 RepID=UPI0034333CD4
MSDGTTTETHTLALLELLAQEAPVGRFEEVLWNARTDGLPADRLARLERGVRLALEVRAAADERRRREASLATLVSAAQELAFQLDLNGVLNAVTARSRLLLDFDMTYVSLRLPDGDSLVYRSDGETTALTEGLRLDRGRGIGEMAQDRQVPFWTPDYLTDDRFPHTADIDEVVGAEGLRAILAVPLIHNDATIGTLYGASRQRRHFNPDEVSLLRNFAGLAAAAIEATRRTERVRAEVSTAYRDGNRTAAALTRTERLAATQSAITDAMVRSAELGDLLKIAADALDGDLRLHETSGRTLATTGELPIPDEADTVRAYVDSKTAAAPVLVPCGLWASHVTTCVTSPGLLLFRPRGSVTDDDLRLLHATGQAMALALLLRHTMAATSGPARDEYLDDLLSDNPPPQRGMTERAYRLGIDTAAQHVVVALRPEGGRLAEAAVWASSYTYLHGGLKTVQGELLVLLLPATDASATARAASRELSALLDCPVSAGAAGPAEGLASVGKVFREAKRCLDALLTLGGAGSTAAASDLGFLGLLLSADHDADAFVAATIGPVLEYDTQRAADLVRTAEAYFTSGGSPTRAAQQLHVHTNTVARRLDRITELLGPHWQRPANALEIQLALRLHRARAALNQPQELPEDGQAERGA